jgi:hypothetical protein
MAIQPRSTFTIRVLWQHRTDDRLRFKIQDRFGGWAKYVFVYSPQPDVWPSGSVNKLFPSGSVFRTQHPRRVDDFGKGHAVFMVRPTLQQDLGKLAFSMLFSFFPDPKKVSAASDTIPHSVPIEIGANTIYDPSDTGDNPLLQGEFILEASGEVAPNKPAPRHR